MPNNTVDEILKMAGLSDAEIASVKKREMVRGTRDSADDRDLAAWFCFLVRAEGPALRETFMSSSKRGTDPSVAQYGHLNDENNDQENSADGEDPFGDVKLEPQGDVMTKLYLTAKPGSCGDLNLSKEEMDKFASLSNGATQADVEAVLRQVLAGRLEEYKQRGLEGISPYCRGRNKDFDPAKELAHKSSILPLVDKLAPAFSKYLREYPSSKPEGLDEAFTWVNFIVNDKPNICLVHKMGMEVDGGGGLYVFCQRHFYVSRGHNTVQGVGGTFPVESDDGTKETLVLYISRTSTDQVSGFGGSAKRTIGAKVMGGKIAENMERFRKLEEQDKK